METYTGPAISIYPGIQSDSVVHNAQLLQQLTLCQWHFVSRSFQQESSLKKKSPTDRQKVHLTTKICVNLKYFHDHFKFCNNKFKKSIKKTNTKAVSLLNSKRMERSTDGNCVAPMIPVRASNAPYQNL